MSTASAIGVTPIRKVVDYEPGKELDLSVKVRNDAERDIKAVTYARGELQSQIAIVDSLVSVEKGSEAIIRYKLSLPAAFEQPGTHKTDLVVMEYPEDFGTANAATATATASVVSELWVRVPYPGKYAEAKVFIAAGKPKEKTVFAVSVMNFGKENIADAYAKIRILGATYEEIASFETNHAAVDAGKEAKLAGEWMADANPGTYHAVAEVYYDSKKIIIEQNFNIGDLFIDITGIDVKDFTLGEVAVLTINLESKWNSPIENVYAELSVLDSKGTSYDTIRTASTTLPPFGAGNVKAYWDTEGIAVGEYSLRVLLHYAERVTERLIETQVNIDSIRMDSGATAKVIASPSSRRDTVLTVLVIILIAVNIGWFAYFMRKKK